MPVAACSCSSRKSSGSARRASVPRRPPGTAKGSRRFAGLLIAWPNGSEDSRRPRGRVSKSGGDGCRRAGVAEARLVERGYGDARVVVLEDFLECGAGSSHSGCAELAQAHAVPPTVPREYETRLLVGDVCLLVQHEEAPRRA